jgi:hypothetical protein
MVGCSLIAVKGSTPPFIAQLKPTRCMQSKTSPECKAPCQDISKLLELKSRPPNATLFAPADLACKGSAMALLEQARSLLIKYPCSSK